MASCCLLRKFSLLTLLIFGFIFVAISTESDEEEEKWKKKHITDYNDADMERLFEQWEEDEEPLEEDELPEWKRPQPKIDMSKFDPNNPEAMLQASKQGRTLMMFATISGNPTEKETESISQLWHSGLFNANYELQRYVVGSNRVLFMLKDGSKAWEIKNFLMEQERCELVTIEGKDYYGKGSPRYKEEEASGKPTSDTKKKGKKKKKTKKEKKDEL